MPQNNHMGRYFPLPTQNSRSTRTKDVRNLGGERERPPYACGPISPAILLYVMGLCVYVMGVHVYGCVHIRVPVCGYMVCQLSFSE